MTAIEKRTTATEPGLLPPAAGLQLPALADGRGPTAGGRRPSSVAVVLLGILVSLFSASSSKAQIPEFRIDGIASNPAAVHAGAGLTIPMGTYVRSGFDAAIGSSEDGISGRVDFVNRFHLDPFRQHGWAPYGGGGLTARFDDNRSNRYYLLLFFGLDSPTKKGIATSIEAGLGGGARLGVILRKARAERR